MFIPFIREPFSKAQMLSLKDGRLPILTRRITANAQAACANGTRRNLGMNIHNLVIQRWNSVEVHSLIGNEYDESRDSHKPLFKLRKSRVQLSHCSACGSETSAQISRHQSTLLGNEKDTRDRVTDQRNESRRVSDSRSRIDFPGLRNSVFGDEVRS